MVWNRSFFLGYGKINYPASIMDARLILYYYKLDVSFSVVQSEDKFTKESIYQIFRLG